MNVVHIKDWEHRRPRPNALKPIPSAPAHLRLVDPDEDAQKRILPPTTDLHDAHLAQEERRRTRQNLGAVAVVVLIVTVGGYLMTQIQAASRVQACFDYGHRNCLPLSAGHAGSQSLRTSP